MRATALSLSESWNSLPELTPILGLGCRGGPSLWSRHSPGLGIYRITSKENVYYLESPPVWLSLWEHRPIHRRSPF